MSKSTSYPQETMGTTLVIAMNGDEWRRVFLRERGGLLEVGEFTRGPITRFYYDAPVHYHCTYVPGLHLKACVKEFFEEDSDRELLDLIDRLNDLGISVGYVDVQMGKFARYRHFEGREVPASA